MSRIQDCFSMLHRRHRVGLIPYITAGDPEPGQTVPLMHALREAGADLIELGVPFSDPMADGPVIQAACERALANKVSLADVLEMVKTFRRSDSKTPVVLMGYQNPIETMRTEVFAGRAAVAGVDGVLVVDLPCEEADASLLAYRENGLDMISMIAPTTTASRIKSINRVASGFVYYVSLKGVTGAHHFDEARVEERMKVIRQYSRLPCAVGFGIKDAESAKAVGRLADAVVVGSALVDLIARHGHDRSRCLTEVSAFLIGLRHALDALIV